jgi:hypothetical protein
MKEMQDGVTRDQEYRGQAGEEETGESRDACDCRRDALDGWTQSRSKVAVDQNGSREKSTLNLDRSAAKSGTDKTRLILLLRVASCEGLQSTASSKPSAGVPKTLRSTLEGRLRNAEEEPVGG